MNCGDCPFAMPCFSDKLSKTTAHGYGAIKLCSQCGHAMITERNGKTTRFKCELREVTPAMHRVHLKCGSVYNGYTPIELQPTTIPDPGPSGGYIELIICPTCHVINRKVRLTASHTGNTNDVITFEASDTNGTDFTT